MRECLIKSCQIISNHVKSCQIISNHVKSYQIISYSVDGRQYPERHKSFCERVMYSSILGGDGDVITHHQCAVSGLDPDHKTNIDLFLAATGTSSRTTCTGTSLPWLPLRSRSSINAMTLWWSTSRRVWPYTPGVVTGVIP